jgi:hypothetical protein
MAEGVVVAAARGFGDDPPIMIEFGVRQLTTPPCFDVSGRACEMAELG